MNGIRSIGPGEIRVNVKEEEGFGLVQKSKHGLNNGGGNVGAESAVGRRERRLQDVHGHGGADFNLVEGVALEGEPEPSHGGEEVEPGGAVGEGEDFVADEEVADFGGGVEGEDVGVNPLVAQGLVGGEIRNELVGEHHRHLEVRVLEGAQDLGVDVVDFDALGVEGFDELEGL